jgi:hypothetical protein
MRSSFLLAIGFVATLTAPALAADQEYTFTWNHGPVTDLVFYATGEGQSNLYLSPQTIPSAGVNSLVHPLSFNAESTIIVGLNVEGGQDHIVMFMNDELAATATGQKWSTVFSGARHSELVSWVTGAHDGDALALGSLTTFLTGPSAGTAAFDPNDSYTIMRFTVGGPGGGPIVPEPASLSILAVGAAGLLLKRRRVV